MVWVTDKKLTQWNIWRGWGGREKKRKTTTKSGSPKAPVGSTSIPMPCLSQLRCSHSQRLSLTWQQWLRLNAAVRAQHCTDPWPWGATFRLQWNPQILCVIITSTPSSVEVQMKKRKQCEDAHQQIGQVPTAARVFIPLVWYRTDRLVPVLRFCWESKKRHRSFPFHCRAKACELTHIDSVFALGLHLALCFRSIYNPGVILSGSNRVIGGRGEYSF